MPLSATDDGEPELVTPPERLGVLAELRARVPPGNAGRALTADAGCRAGARA